MRDHLSVRYLYAAVLSVDIVVPPHVVCLFFFLMIRRPPRSTLDRSSAASDVYKRQPHRKAKRPAIHPLPRQRPGCVTGVLHLFPSVDVARRTLIPVSYTHLRAHETVLDLVCRLLLEKKKKQKYNIIITLTP